MTDPTSLTELPDVDAFVSTLNERDYTVDQKNFLLQKYQDTALNLAKDDETINTARESQEITDEGPSTIPVSENYDSFSRYVLGGINKAKLDVNKDRAQEVYRSTIRERYQNEEEFNVAANNIAQYEQFGGPPVDNVIKDMGAAQRAVNEELRISGAYNQVGSMRDSVDNPLARFNVLYNSSNSPEYARITLHNEGEFIDDPETADFLSFPKGFDPVTAYVDSLKRQQRDLLDQVEQAAYNPLESLHEFAGNATKQEELTLEARNIGNQIKMSEQLIQAKNQGFIEEASQKGVEAYVQQYIRDQAEAGNPKYQNIGQGFLEGSLATVWGGVRRAYLSGQASLLSLREQGQRAMLDVAQSIVGDSPELQQRISPGMEGVSREAEIINLQRGKLSSRAQEIGREQRFSGLEVTSPFAGEMLRDVADAVYQGGESVVTSGVGALVGGPVGAVIGATGYAYLQASGNKALELSALERQRRKEGDIDGANYIRDNQGYLSILSGATEALTERFSPGDVAFGALNRSRRAITSGIGEIAGEGLEGATVGLADAVQGFYLEGKSAEETAEAFATLPKQAVLEMVGATLPVGIRSLRGLGKNKSDEVDRQVIKDVVQTKLQEIDAVAQEQNITREEAAQVVVNNREEAIRRANEYASVTEGNLGDEPRIETIGTGRAEEGDFAPMVDFVGSGDFNISLAGDQDTEAGTSTDEVLEGTLDITGDDAPVRPEFGGTFTLGEAQRPSSSFDDLGVETGVTTDEALEVGINAQGDDAPIVIETGQQAAGDVSPAVTEIQEARGFIQSLSTPQEGREQETIDAVSNLSPEALNDLSSFVSTNFQRDPNPEVLSFQLPPQEGQAQEYDPSQVAVISDRHGNTRLISTPSLIEKINSGEIDPKNNYFYLSSSLRGENASPELSSALDSIPARNVVNFTPEQVGYRSLAQAQAEAPTATPAPQAEGEAQTQEAEQPAQEAEVVTPTAAPSPIDGVIAYAATVRARGREALAELTVEDAIRGRDVQNEVREAEFENRQLFSADRSEYEQGYKFNGTQQDLDGNPSLDLYTIYDDSHPFNGSTISVRHGTPASGVLDYIEQKRNQQFSPDRNTIDDVFAQLNTGNAVEVSQLTERLADSQDKIIATTARLLSQAPQNAVEGVQVRRDKNVRRSYYQRQNEDESAEIVLGRNAGEDVILHEVVHAYTDPLIEQEMGDLLRNAVTGSDYKAVLDNYLKNGKNKKLKTVIGNYIATVNALGYSDSVFGNARRSTSVWNGDPLHYGLQDIREFCSEVVMEPALISRINAIQNPFQESLFKRLIRSILDFFSSTLLNGYTPFYNRVFSDLITFVNEGHVITPREKEIINRTPPALNTDLTREIDLAAQIAEKGTLNDFDKSTLSGLNHRKAKASPAIKDTTVYARSVTRDELLNTRRVKSRRSDTAIDVTLESTIDQMLPEGLAMIWDEKANGGSFISILDDGSLSPEDIDTLKERGIDVISESERLFMKAYHGTPHTIRDSFSLNKIGTGEGAQAFGWGLYFAQQKGVAKSYIKKNDFDWDVEKKDPRAMDEAKEWLSSRGINWKDYEDWEDEIPVLAFEQGWIPSWVDKSIKGNLYTVELDVNDDDLLDWDSPISDRIKNLLPDIDESSTGEEAYKALAERFKNPEPDPEQPLIPLGEKDELQIRKRLTNEYLLSIGIPGIRYLASDSWMNPAIRYLEGDSRTNGDDTYNYVIFDESKINITDVNDEDLLDLDKPLRKQSEKVRNLIRNSSAMERVGYTFGVDVSNNSGSLFYEDLASRFASPEPDSGQRLIPLSEKGESQIKERRASEYLLSLGIPGIRYLDGLSRDDGTGTYNYVIFDESKITITEVNGKPVPPPDFGRLYSKESESAGTKRHRRAPSPTRELEGITFNNEFLTTDQKRRINSIRSQLAKGTIPSEVALTELREIKESSDTAEFTSLKALYPEALAGKDIDNLTDAQVAVIDWLEDNHRDPENLDHPKRTKARIQKVLDFRDQVQALQEGNHAAFNSISDPRITSIINESIDFMLNNFNPREISNRQLTAWTKALRLFNESEGRNISGFSRTAAKIATSKIIKRLEDGKRKAGVGFEETPSFKVFGAPISNVRRGALRQSKTGIALSDVTTELDAIFNRKDTKDAIISILSDYHTSLNDFNVMEDDLLTSYKNRIKEIQDRYKSRGKPTLLDDSRIQIVKRVTQFEIGAKTTPLQQIRNNLAQELTSIDRKKKAEGNQRAIDEGIIDEQAYRDVAQSLADQIDNQIITDESTAIDFIEDQLDSYQLEILKLIREPGTQYWNQLDTVNQLSVGIPGSTRKQLHPWANYAKRSQRPLRTETFSNFWGEAGFNSALSVLQQRQGLGEDKKNVFTSSWQTDLEQQLTETAYEITTGPARVQLFQAFRDQQMVDTLDNGVPTAPRTDRMKQQLGNIHSFTRNQELRLPDLLQTVVATTSWVQALNLFNITQPLNQLIPALLYIGKRPTILWNTVRTRIGAKSGKKAQDDFIKKHSPFLYNRMNHYEQLVEKQRTKWQRRGMETGINQLDTLSRDIIRNLSKFWKNTSDIAQYIGTIPTHVAVGLSEAFSAKAVFMSIYANELAERGLISDPNDFLYGRNMVYDRDVITFAELELERYILTPLNTALRGEMWQKTSLGKELIRQGAFSLLRTSIQQSLKSTTSVRDTYDAIKDHLRTGTAESKEHVRNKLEDFAVQQMQMALYYGVRLISMSINTSLGSSAAFIAAAALQGDEDDKEEWMRRYRVLNRVYSDQSATYLFQQFLTDLAYQYFPVGHLQNNIGRAFIQNIFSFFQSWPFNDERLKSDIEDLEATSKILDKRIKDYEKLGQTNKAIDLDVAREYVETTLTASKEALRNKASFLTKLTDNITGNILPVTDEFRQRAKALEEIIVPRNDDLAQQMIKESKSNQAWWAISWALSIASPSRRASERVIKERAQADYQSRKGEERRYNEGTEALNDTDRTQNIDIPDGFEETVPARLYE